MIIVKEFIFSSIINITYYYIARQSSGKSGHCEWFFLGWDFAIYGPFPWKTVISHVLFVFKSPQIWTLARAIMWLNVIKAKLNWRWCRPAASILSSWGGCLTLQGLLGILKLPCWGQAILFVLSHVAQVCKFAVSLPSLLLGKYMLVLLLVSNVMMLGWIPLTGLSWLPAALGCSSCLYQPLRHLPHAHLLLMSLTGKYWPWLFCMDHAVLGIQTVILHTKTSYL